MSKLDCMALTVSLNVSSLRVASTFDNYEPISHRLGLIGSFDRPILRHSTLAKSVSPPCLDAARFY